MQYAGLQNVQGTSGTTHSNTLQYGQQQQSGDGVVSNNQQAAHSPPNNNNSTTSILRNYRKDSIGLENKLPDSESGSNGGEIQGPVARVAPHAYYPKQNGDGFRYQHFPDFGMQTQQIVPPPVKYSEIIEPPIQGLDLNHHHLSSHMMSSKPSSSDKGGPGVIGNIPGPSNGSAGTSYLDMSCGKPSYDYNFGVRSMNSAGGVYKQQFPLNASPYHHHPHHHPASNHHTLQMPSQVQHHQQYQNYTNKMAQYQRGSYQGNDFLSNLNKIAPDIAQDIINDQHLREQFPVYLTGENHYHHHRLYPNHQSGQSNRIYQRNHHQQRNLNYNINNLSNINNLNSVQYQRNFQENFRLYQNHHVPPPNLRFPTGFEQIPQRGSYDRSSFPPGFSNCSQIDYPNFHQSKIHFPSKNYLETNPEIPEIVPEVDEDDDEENSHKDSQSGKSLKAYLENWNEESFLDDQENTNLDKENNTLYVLETTEIPSESVNQYIHLQPIEKLPPNVVPRFISDGKQNNAPACKLLQDIAINSQLKHRNFDRINEINQHPVLHIPDDIKSSKSLPILIEDDDKDTNNESKIKIINDIKILNDKNEENNDNKPSVIKKNEAFKENLIKNVEEEKIENKESTVRNDEIKDDVEKGKNENDLIKKSDENDLLEDDLLEDGEDLLENEEDLLENEEYLLENKDFESEIETNLIEKTCKKIDDEKISENDFETVENEKETEEVDENVVEIVEKTENKINEKNEDKINEKNEDKNVENHEIKDQKSDEIKEEIDLLKKDDENDLKKDEIDEKLCFQRRHIRITDPIRRNYIQNSPSIIQNVPKSPEKPIVESPPSIKPDIKEIEEVISDKIEIFDDHKEKNEEIISSSSNESSDDSDDSSSSDEENENVNKDDLDKCINIKTDDEDDDSLLLSENEETTNEKRKIKDNDKRNNKKKKNFYPQNDDLYESRLHSTENKIVIRKMMAMKRENVGDDNEKLKKLRKNYQEINKNHVPKVIIKNVEIKSVNEHNLEIVDENCQENNHVPKVMIKNVDINRDNLQENKSESVNIYENHEEISKEFLDFEKSLQIVNAYNLKTLNCQNNNNLIPKVLTKNVEINRNNLQENNPESVNKGEKIEEISKELLNIEKKTLQSVDEHNLKITDENCQESNQVPNVIIKNDLQENNPESVNKCESNEGISKKLLNFEKPLQIIDEHNLKIIDENYQENNHITKVIKNVEINENECKDDENKEIEGEISKQLLSFDKSESNNFLLNERNLFEINNNNHNNYAISIGKTDLITENKIINEENIQNNDLINSNDEDEDKNQMISKNENFCDDNEKIDTENIEKQQSEKEMIEIEKEIKQFGEKSKINEDLFKDNDFECENEQVDKEIIENKNEEIENKVVEMEENLECDCENKQIEGNFIETKLTENNEPNQIEEKSCGDPEENSVVLEIFKELIEIKVSKNEFGEKIIIVKPLSDVQVVTNHDRNNLNNFSNQIDNEIENVREEIKEDVEEKIEENHENIEEIVENLDFIECDNEVLLETDPILIDEEIEMNEISDEFIGESVEEELIENVEEIVEQINKSIDNVDNNLIILDQIVEIDEEKVDINEEKVDINEENVSPPRLLPESQKDEIEISVNKNCLEEENVVKMPVLEPMVVEVGDKTRKKRCKLGIMKKNLKRKIPDGKLKKKNFVITKRKKKNQKERVSSNLKAKTTIKTTKKENLKRIMEKYKIPKKKIDPVEINQEPKKFKRIKPLDEAKPTEINLKEEENVIQTNPLSPLKKKVQFDLCIEKIKSNLKNEIDDSNPKNIKSCLKNDVKNRFLDPLKRSYSHQITSNVVIEEKKRRLSLEEYNKIRKKNPILENQQKNDFDIKSLTKTIDLDFESAKMQEEIDKAVLKNLSSPSLIKKKDEFFEDVDDNRENDCRDERNCNISRQSMVGSNFDSDDEVIDNNEICLNKINFVDKSIVEEKINSLEEFLPKFSRITSRSITSEEAISQKIDDLFSNRPMYEQRDYRINRFLQPKITHNLAKTITVNIDFNDFNYNLNDKLSDNLNVNTLEMEEEKTFNEESLFRNPERPSLYDPDDEKVIEMERINPFENEENCLNDNVKDKINHQIIDISGLGLDVVNENESKIVENDVLIENQFEPTIVEEIQNDDDKESETEMNEENPQENQSNEEINDESKKKNVINLSKLNALIQIYKKIENNTTTSDTDKKINLEKIKSIINQVTGGNFDQILKAFNKNINTNIDENPIEQKTPLENKKIGKSKKRKRFRNLHDPEEENADKDVQSLIEKRCKYDDYSIVNGATSDGDVSKLVIKLKKTGVENGEPLVGDGKVKNRDLYVQLTRIDALERMVKRKQRTIKLKIR